MSSFLRKSKRKRVPTKHLIYTEDGTSKSDETPHKSRKTRKRKSEHVSRVTILVKKTYDRVRRTHTIRRAAEIKSHWAENIKKLDNDLENHQKYRLKSISHIDYQNQVSTEELVNAFQSAIAGSESTSEKAKITIIPEELFNPKTLRFSHDEICIKSPMITIPSLNQIPPVLAWTSIPYNIHEDDGKFLTNIPFLGDSVIENDRKFISDMVNLYEGKIHGICDNKRVRMEDEIFFDFVKALISLEEKNGPGLFKENKSPTTSNVSVDATKDVIKDSEKPSEDQEVKTEIQSTSSSSDAIDKYIDKVLVPSNTLLSAICTTFKGIGTVEELRERYELICRKRQQPPKIRLPLLPSGVIQQDPSTYSIPNIEGKHAKDLPKQSAMHAYQFLFCRRCFQYDCPRGHNGDDHVDLKYYKQTRNPTSFNMNFVCENPNCWQLKTGTLETTETVTRSKEDILAQWSPGDKSMFRCLIDSFPNHCYVANLMMDKTCQQVNEYASLGNDPTGDLECNVVGETSQKSSTGTNINNSKRKSKPWSKKSSSVNKKNLARRWINNVKRSEKTTGGGIKTGGVLPPRFMPCQHDNTLECDEKNPQCYCGTNGTCCEKFCTCPKDCKRRFPGCRCSSTCDSKRCVCFFAARECDPDLCFGCGANEATTENISCRNVNIQRRLHKHLLMGKSDVAGWGIFIKDEAQRGEFIAEYRGEIISHDESERRGHVYDKIQHTFLFELNDHFVVDATRKGNKARFVNSSKSPNCEVKRMLVNGDHRIGIYAKRYIEAGEELFYDYEDVLEKQQKVAAASTCTTTSTTTTSQTCQSQLFQL